MNVAVILSGGSGTRMGLSIPKQYFEIKGKMVIEYCLDTFLHLNRIDSILICLASEWIPRVKEVLSNHPITKPVYFAESGLTRQGTVINAMEALYRLGIDDNDIVLIHEAARPLVSETVICRCLEAMKYADAALPVVPVKNTTYLSHDGKSVDSILDRQQLWSGQAPEAFRFGAYYNVIKSSSIGELLTLTGGTEAAFKAGLKCDLVEGEESNFKITTHTDLAIFEKILENNH